MALYNELLERAVHVRIDGNVDLGAFLSEVARVVMLGKERDAAALLRTRLDPRRI